MPRTVLARDGAGSSGALVVHGGVPLSGGVRVSGAKNAALPLMAAGLLTDEPVLLRGVPGLTDVLIMRQLLGSLGVESAEVEDGLWLRVVDDVPTDVPATLIRELRAGICVLGPLLARRGRATVPLPGGCRIGDRPIDLHLRGLHALGARLTLSGGRVEAWASCLKGGRVDLSGPFGTTVTGTCNLLCAAVLARGQTLIHPAAREPEVVDLGELLKAMGARIAGLGTPELSVEGVPRLHGTSYRIIPDRVEAATFMVAGALGDGEVRLEGVRCEHLAATVAALRRIGARVEEDHGSIAVQASGRLRPAQLTTLPYPGLPTDVQPQLTALLCRVPGASIIRETVFQDRFTHLEGLTRMGADVERAGATVVVRGPCRFRGARVTAPDLRAGAAILIAALSADGETVIQGLDCLDRGYERLEAKLLGLGASVERVR
jgi:UDP-N-acetylglucosamine 1-carboxyvinyltransferase